jgi:hypothetical protein
MACRARRTRLSRVPDHPPRPIRAIRTLQEHLDAGLVIRSFCSSGQGHSHVVELGALIAERGSNVEVDYAFKRSLICPQCGAHGGGLIVEASN